VNFKPKLACACVDNFWAGVVLFDAIDSEIACGIPSFNPDGSLFNLAFCTTGYVIVH
jgi:hypothetical protein